MKQPLKEAPLKTDPFFNALKKECKVFLPKTLWV